MPDTQQVITWTLPIFLSPVNVECAVVTVSESGTQSGLVPSLSLGMIICAALAFTYRNALALPAKFVWLSIYFSNCFKFTSQALSAHTHTRHVIPLQIKTFVVRLTIFLDVHAVFHGCYLNTRSTLHCIVRPCVQWRSILGPEILVWCVWLLDTSQSKIYSQ